MPDHVRYTINRVGIVLRPLPPFVQWVHDADPAPGLGNDMSIGDVREHADIFLVPEGLDELGSAVKWVEQRWRMFFEFLLNEYYTDESLWPAKRSLKLFRLWIEIEVLPMVWDVATTPIEIEDWDRADF